MFSQESFKSYLEWVNTRKPQYVPVSKIIKNRLNKMGKSFLANDNISDAILSEDELTALKAEVEEKIQGVLESLVIDTKNDHNTKETAKRVAKMYIDEVFKGRYIPRPKITDFPNVRNLDELYILGPITIRSACSHHMVPITGTVTVGILPSEQVIGISKFPRIADWIMSRPHIQEEAVIMLADELEEIMKPKGLGIILNAKHECMTWRGVKDNDCTMTNSVMRGLMHDDATLRAEFLNLVNIKHSK